jgi:hypothetical protein
MKVPVSQATRKIVWARSGNRCARCQIPLIAEATERDDRAVVGEECHIYAQGTDGPRGQGTPPKNIHHYSNLILLCGACHTLVDAQEATYTIEKLHALRDAHEQWVEATLQKATGEMAPPTDLSGSNEWGDGEALPSDVGSADIVAGRLADAFPGSYGLTVISDPKAALERLAVVLRRPLHQWYSPSNGEPYKGYPLWWFRGGRCLHIEDYDQVSATHAVLDGKELNVRRVAAFRRNYLSMWDFLYVESAADQPVGIYQYSGPTPIERAQQSPSGFFTYEEYAVWNDRAISREDFDDGATLVNGKPQRVVHAEVRQRFLTPYNFIVCGNRHVINDKRHDRTIQALLDGILRGDRTLSDLVSFVDALVRPARFASDWD